MALEAMMDLDALRHNWEMLGNTDPLWAIYAEPSKRGNRWSLDEFFATGVAEIGYLMEYLDDLPVKLRRARALDFGCGVGRLTQALAGVFERADGVDIATSMIDLARVYNRHGDRCMYHVNTRSDLALFPDAAFDLIYSVLVLQHMEPRYAEEYIAEFLRVLRPGGLAVFAVPAARKAADEPVEASDFLRAKIELIGAVPTRVLGGARLTVRTRVTNTGSVAWPPSTDERQIGVLRLGNHWLDDAWRMLQQDDGRAMLHQHVAPGVSLDLDLVVTVPCAAGHYTLELDMVQEAVTWFADRGSPSLCIPIAVTGPRPPRPEPEVAVMEMHVIPRERVCEVVAQAGGQIVDVRESKSAGPEFVSFQYCVAAGPE